MTYARFTSFSFSASSFCFCFTWFSFLRTLIEQVWGLLMMGKDAQSDVFGIQHPFDKRKLAGLFGLDLCKLLAYSVSIVDNAYHPEYKDTKKRIGVYR